MFESAIYQTCKSKRGTDHQLRTGAKERITVVPDGQEKLHEEREADERSR